jgi:hypothetical protein
MYNTQHVIVAGDFNAVLSPEDSNDHHIRKTRTTGKLHLLNNMTSQIWPLLQTNISTLGTDRTATNPQGLT